MRKKIKRFLKWLFVGLCIYWVTPELIHENEGKSTSSGSVGNGNLQNPYLMPYWGENFSYFSPISYFVLNSGYLHHRLHQTLLDSYKICEQTCPKREFCLMECANREGGKMLLHYTHQNGLSVDFMTPLKKGKEPFYSLDHLGLWHYLLEFDDNGRSSLNESIEIDFETMAKHILALDEAARKNGLSVKMVILKVELKDEFFKTPSGQKVKQRGIYFAQNLRPHVNRLHDDHYHIDFEANSSTIQRGK
ncbi:MAG: hypothetical protein AAF740_01740 [Bacteroidota bacterium]